MRTTVSLCVGAAALVLASALPSSAQRIAFERAYDVGATPTLDVSTIRGKIDVSVGDANRVVVRGTATVRWGLSVPSTAYELVKQVAANPPILHDGDTIRLRPPAGADEQRAMTVAYDVTVPRGTVVRTNSDSGATTVSGVDGRVSIHTQSAAIDVRDLGGETDVTTGSGEVQADGINGDSECRDPEQSHSGPRYARSRPSCSHPERRCRRKPSRTRGREHRHRLQRHRSDRRERSADRDLQQWPHSRQWRSGRAMAGDERFGQLRSGL